MPKKRDEVFVTIAFPIEDLTLDPDPKESLRIAKLRAEQMNGRRHEAHVTRVIDEDTVDVAVTPRVNVAEEGAPENIQRPCVGGFSEAKRAKTFAETKLHGRWWTTEQQKQFKAEQDKE